MNDIAGKKKISRRDFLSVALATPLVIRENSRPFPRIEFGKNNALQKRRIIIVGAGLAGATIAYRLLSHGITDFQVLDARERIGGRVLDSPLSNGHVAELGGSWVDNSQRYIIRLAHELDISTFKTVRKGRRLFRIRRQVISEPLLPEELRNPPGLNDVLNKLDKLSARIMVKEPWNTKQSKQLDSHTVGTWLSHEVEFPVTADYIANQIRLFVGAKPSELSLLYFLYLIRASGGISNLFKMEEKVRFVEGPQRLCELMLDKGKRQLALKSPVRRIVHRAESDLIVECADRNFSAPHVVVTMSPGDLQRIKFEPGLPEAKVKLMEGWKSGAWHKMNIVYETPFWREQGLSGEAYSDDGPVAATFDNSPPGGMPGVLLALVRTGFVKGFLGTGEEEIKRFVKKIFGKETPEPVTFIDENWSKDSWSSGCKPVLPVGLLSEYGHAIREPVGGLHFAGSETSTFWPGHMEGAVRSGERTLHELLQLIAPEKLKQ